MSESRGLSRRYFFGRALAGLAGAGLAAKEATAATDSDRSASPVQIRDHRILGRTGFKVSDLAAGYMQDEGLTQAALEAGVNYLDTAEQYPGHHRALARVIKGRDRKKLFITTKLEVKEDTSREGFIKRTRKALEELETDYIDCLMMHMPETVETLKTEGFHTAMAELKTEGRVRFVGVSNHGSFWFRDPAESMEKVLLAAAEDGRFDVFLLAYNFLKMDQGEKVLEACRERNIGAALMKATPIAIYYTLKTRVEQLQQAGKDVPALYAAGLERYKAKLDRASAFIAEHNLQNPNEIKAAAVRFCLDNPRVNTVCFVARTFEDLELFLGLSGTRLTSGDKAKLAAYSDGCGDLYCRHACGECEPTCPQGVPVNTIMRYFHYYGAQGREREAMLKYAAIPGNRADVCRSCPGFCESVCPHQVPIQGMLLTAHSQFSLAAPSTSPG